jgi:hypothetical protein
MDLNNIHIMACTMCVIVHLLDSSFAREEENLSNNSLRKHPGEKEKGGEISTRSKEKEKSYDRSELEFICRHKLVDDLLVSAEIFSFGWRFSFRLEGENS